MYGQGSIKMKVAYYLPTNQIFFTNVKGPSENDIRNWEGAEGQWKIANYGQKKYQHGGGGCQ